MQLTNKQEKGLLISIERYKAKEKYTVISGYAGSGKSTLVRFIIDALDVNEEDVCYCAFTGKAASKRIVAVGEVGLTGHLRSIPNADKIVQEAVRLGYEAVILPERNARHAAETGIVSISDSGRAVTVSPAGSGGGIRVTGAANIADAIRAYLS